MPGGEKAEDDLRSRSLAEAMPRIHRRSVRVALAGPQVRVHTHAEPALPIARAARGDPFASPRAELAGFVQRCVVSTRPDNLVLSKETACFPCCGFVRVRRVDRVRRVPCWTKCGFQGARAIPRSETKNHRSSVSLVRRSRRPTNHEHVRFIAGRARIQDAKRCQACTVVDATNRAST